MKQCLMIALMTLGMASPALANYTCYQKLGDEVLKVVHSELSFKIGNPHAAYIPPATATAVATATLETPVQILKFTGKYISESYTGGHFSFGYNLTDEQGQPVDLDIKKTPIEYGGGCKRCGNQIIMQTFAKLTLANGEVHDFECD